MTQWKAGVADAFGAAADSYDARAGIQRQVARHLCHDIQGARQGMATRRILEIGCGTGALSALLLPLCSCGAVAGDRYCPGDGRDLCGATHRVPP